MVNHVEDFINAGPQQRFQIDCAFYYVLFLIILNSVL